MDLPCVLIASTEKGIANDLARDMDGKFLADGNGDVKYYSWDIDNKYYSAKVMLCTTETIPLGVTLDNVEALILHYTPAEDEPQSLDKYIPLIQSYSDAEVLLLACKYFIDPQKRDEVLEWCHIHKFELVDMEYQGQSNDFDDDMEPEKYGIERIIEALHTHTWSNRVLKGLVNGRISTSAEPDVSQIEDQLDNIRLNAQRGNDHLLMESVLDGIMGEENTDFGELFGQLVAMKEHAATLTPSNRRAAAEQLVTAFWKAMGGDPSEVEDLDE